MVPRASQRTRVFGMLLTWLVLTCASHAAPADHFIIQVLDAETGRGVPLVELRTVSNVPFYTDSQGIVALLDPDLMGRKVFFHVRSHGYEYPKNGLGIAGKAFDVRAGERVELRIKRVNIAERLYRITGAGIYRDSVLAGVPVPLREPLLAGEVTGQDSALAVPFQGKLYWFWGDTGRLRYPLGLFSTAGATAELVDQGGLDPSVGVNLTYFTGTEGFCRAMCPLPEPGLVWLDGLCVLPDESGRPRMIAHYNRMKSLGERLEHGLAVWDEQEAVFRKRAQWQLDAPWQCPRSHPFRWKDGDIEYLLFPTPFATVRVRADWQSVFTPECYEAFTCLPPGTRYAKGQAGVERNAQGELLYAWKRGTDPISAQEEQELLAAGQIRPEEARFLPKDVVEGQTVLLHSGSMSWSEYRGRWMLIAVQVFGSSSLLGEVWFSESESPVGPWRYARKIVTHDQYSFYNPVHHPFLDRDGGREIYFEGTYTAAFSGTSQLTPRYDYNQIMYRLDLADPRLPSPLEPVAAEATPAGSGPQDESGGGVDRF